MESLDAARNFLSSAVEFRHESYDPSGMVGFDLAVFPLAFVGDRAAIYRHPPAPVVLVHDWIWRKRGSTTRVSWLLLKRLNLVRP
jgi:hypothetical protein